MMDPIRLTAQLAFIDSITVVALRKQRHSSS